MHKFVAAIAAFLAGSITATAADAAALPPGWIKAGSAPASYTIELAAGKPGGGKHSALLRASGADPDGFGTLMQQCQVGAYRGQRVRLSANVKTEGVKAWAGLWFRVDGDERSSLAFDNMEDRPLKGTQDWKRYEVVLPVVSKATSLHYGVLLVGDGKVWLDDVKLEMLGPADDKEAPAKRTLQPAPRNLGFEE